MTTPLVKIYDNFLLKVTDYSFIKLNEDGELDKILLGYLKSSTVKFTNCDKDLSIDELNENMIEDLTFEEIEILSTLMVQKYVDGKVIHVKNMEQVMTEPEFKIYSQANHLKELLSLKSSVQLDVSELLNNYSLKKGLEDFS